MSGSRKDDPYAGYRFIVEIHGMTAGGFTDVSGLGVETEIETRREGGVNDYEYKLPARSKYTDIILRRGAADADLLWNWHQDVVRGKFERKNGSIYLLNESGENALWWDFFEAYPVKWEGPSLNALSSAVAVETLTLTHQGLSRVKA